MANNPPKRSDFPAGSEGYKLFQQALAVYQRTGAASALGLPSKGVKETTKTLVTEHQKKKDAALQKATTRGKGLRKGTTYKKGGYVNPKSNKRKGASWSNRDNQFD